MSDDLLRVHEKFSQRDLWTLVKPQVRKAAAAAARHANADVLEQAQSWIKDAHVDRPLELVFRAWWDALKFHEGVEWAHLHPTVVLVGGHTYRIDLQVAMDVHPEATAPMCGRPTRMSPSCSTSVSGRGRWIIRAMTTIVERWPCSVPSGWCAASVDPSIH